MRARRLSQGLIAAGVLLLAVSAGFGLAGVSIDQAAGQALGGQAGSAVVEPGLGGGAPDVGADAGAAGTQLPFTGGEALYVALVGVVLIGAGVATRRFGLAE